MDLRRVVLNFIPVAAIFYATKDPAGFALLAHTPGGRLAAVTCIILFSLENALLGAAACLSAIAFYLSDWRADTFVTYKGAYPMAASLDSESESESKNAIAFRETNCDGGVLSYKSFPVRSELAEFVYPNLSFVNTACNPCDRNCRIRVK